MAQVVGNELPDFLAFAGGGEPWVLIHDGQTGELTTKFLAHAAHYGGGLFGAAADLNGDGWTEILTATGGGRTGKVRVFSPDGTLQARFKPFGEEYEGPVHIAVGDTDGDGRPEIVAAKGEGRPVVRVFDGTTFAEEARFLAYDPSMREGVFVTTGDLDGNGTAEIITGAGSGALVNIFTGTGETVGSFLAFEGEAPGGLRVGTAQLNPDDAISDIIVAQGSGSTTVRAFDGSTFVQLPGDIGEFSAFPPWYSTGVYISGGNDPATVTLDLSSLSVNELDGTAKIGIVFTGTANPSVEVTYATTAGTALAGSDFTSTSGTVKFTSGNETQYINIPIIDNSIGEASDSFTFAVTKVTGGSIGSPNKATVTIADDDTPTITIDDVTLSEGDSGSTEFNFEVKLSNASDLKVSVTYETVDGTAKTGTDYESIKGTVTFNAGETSQWITVNVTGDTVYEPDVDFLVELSAPTNAKIADSQGKGIILNNDPNNPPVVVNPGNQGGTEGAVVSLQISATDPENHSLMYYAVNLPPGLSISESTGQITGTIDYAAADFLNGTYPVTVLVIDDQGGLTSQPFTWTVTNTNRPPEVSQPVNQTSAEGEWVALLMGANDPDGNPLTWSATGLPAGLLFDPNDGTIFGKADFQAAETGGGVYTLTVTATDSLGAAHSQTFTWTVSPTNLPPQVEVLPDQRHDPGTAVTLAVGASDPDNDTLTYTAEGLPPGLAIDPQAGVISGTIEASVPGGSAFEVTVWASDGGLSGGQSFVWVVGNAPPQVVNPGPLTNSEGERVSWSVSASDPQEDPLTFAAVNLPAGLTIDPASGLVSGALAFTAAETSNGVYEVTITATDSFGANHDQIFTWTVAPAEVAVYGAPLGATEGAAFTDTVVAAFSAAGTGAPPGAFSAAIDWGDGSPVATGQVVSDSQPGTYLVLGGHTYADAGTNAVTVTVSQALENWIAVSDATVADAPLVGTGAELTTAEGAALSGATVASFTDPDPASATADFVATIEWGDGAVSEGIVTAVGPGNYEVRGDHGYADVGDFVLAVWVAGEGDTATLIEATAHVEAAPLVAQFASMETVEGTQFTGVVATFTDPNAYESTSAYTAEVTWGDGTTSPADFIRWANDHYEVVATHTFAEAGPRPVTVTIHDDDATTVSVSGETTVGAASLTPDGWSFGVAQNKASPQIIATFRGANPLSQLEDYSVQIDWGDGTPFDKTGEIILSGGTIAVRGQHSYTTAMSHPVTVHLLPSGGPALVAQSTAVVKPSLPRPFVAFPSILTGFGQALLPNSPLAYFISPFSHLPGSLTATIDWEFTPSPPDIALH